MFWFFGGLGLLFLCLALFTIFFWVWMLVDCLSRKKFEDKLVWVIVLLFLNFIGAILYYILVKSKD
jgi:O-antigen/teichoic acid export membrane protein